MNLDELLAILEEAIMVQPNRRLTQAGLENYLDTAADILRGREILGEITGHETL